MATPTNAARPLACCEPRTRTVLVLESIALRHQIVVLERSGTRRPCFRLWDRLFWLLLMRWWSGWRDSLVIVQQATVLRWRRCPFSKPNPARRKPDFSRGRKAKGRVNGHEHFDKIQWCSSCLRTRASSRPRSSLTRTSQDRIRGLSTIDMTFSLSASTEFGLSWRG
jgi:hypothetical protein